MMSTNFCTECHQPISHVVEGIRLPKFKAALFRYIRSHPGQSSAELGWHFYAGAGRDPARSIRSHIHQINEALADTGVRVQGGVIVGYHISRSHVANG